MVSCGLFQADLAGVEAGAIDDDLDLVFQVVLLEGHHQAHDVAQAGQVELRDEQYMRGRLHRDHVDRAVGLGEVEDQMRERRFQQADHALHVVGRDQLGVFELDRPRQQEQAGGVLGERSLEEREVEPRDVLCHVYQRVVGDRVEKDVGVAETQVEVYERDGVLRVAASVQPRLTAMLVVPTPPVAPRRR